MLEIKVKLVITRCCKEKFVCVYIQNQCNCMCIQIEWNGGKML
jgi:hypothetical protein